MHNSFLTPAILIAFLGACLLAAGAAASEGVPVLVPSVTTDTPPPPNAKTCLTRAQDNKMLELKFRIMTREQWRKRVESELKDNEAELAAVERTDGPISSRVLRIKRSIAIEKETLKATRKQIIRYEAALNELSGTLSLFQFSVSYNEDEDDYEFDAEGEKYLEKITEVLATPSYSCTK